MALPSAHWAHAASPCQRKNGKIVATGKSDARPDAPTAPFDSFLGQSLSPYGSCSIVSVHGRFDFETYLFQHWPQPAFNDLYLRAIPRYDFLHDEERQRSFTEAGFRPPDGVDVEVDAQKFDLEESVHA